MLRLLIQGPHFENHFHRGVNSPAFFQVYLGSLCQASNPGKSWVRSTVDDLPTVGCCRNDLSKMVRHKNMSRHKGCLALFKYFFFFFLLLIICGMLH